MHWKEIEKYSRCLASKLPSIEDVQKLKTHLGVDLPQKLDDRFKNVAKNGKDLVFINLYLEILISWSVTNENKNMAASLQGLLSKYEVQFNEEPVTNIPSSKGKLIEKKNQLHTIKYCAEDEIDEGGSNRVYKGIYTVGRLVKYAAIKRILYASLGPDKSEEVEAQEENRSDFVISNFHTFWDGKFVYIAMELAECHIKSWLDKEDPEKMSTYERQLYKAQIVKFLHNVCSGLESLHSKKSIHRDLNPRNVLICKQTDGKLVAKIADFGISRKFNAEGVKTNNPQRGTWGWRPPEVMVEEEKSTDLSPSYDKFALGLLIYYVASNKEHLFSQNRSRDKPQYDKDIENNIKAGKTNWELGIGSVFHVNEVRFLVEGLINPDPGKRTNISKVLEHPIFWDDKGKLNFLQLLNSDFTSNLKKPEYEQFKAMINAEFKSMSKWTDGWKELLCVELKEFFSAKINQRFNYDKDECTALVRFIADKKRHYELIEITPSLLVPDIFGKDIEFYDKYFLELFNYLVPMLYESTQNTTLKLKCVSRGSVG